MVAIIHFGRTYLEVVASLAILILSVCMLAVTMQQPENLMVYFETTGKEIVFTWRMRSVADVIHLSSSDTGSPRDWREVILSLTKEAADALISSREREGGRLGLMLIERISQLRALAAKAVPLVPQLVLQQRQRFMDRWKEAMSLTDGAALPEVAQDRALAEATAFAIRIDVAEEITRLNSHLDEIERLINKGGEVGKRLDFLIQELHREANTMGSKSAALELTHISVDMKVLIEQMREQVQNIE